jgi:hypothetical protein
MLVLLSSGVDLSPVAAPKELFLLPPEMTRLRAFSSPSLEPKDPAERRRTSDLSVGPTVITARQG